MAACEAQTVVADRYNKVLEWTHSMLDAAQKGDWDRLVKTEVERGRMIDQIRDFEGGVPASEEEITRQRQVIEEILVLDQQIKLLTQDWMHELRDILGSATAQRLLNRTYGE